MRGLIFAFTFGFRIFDRPPRSGFTVRRNIIDFAKLDDLDDQVGPNASCTRTVRYGNSVLWAIIMPLAP